MMRMHEIEKKELGDGWVEVRLVTFRGMATPDFSERGEPARKRIAELFLAGAAGIADRLGYPEVNGLLADLWLVCQRSFP